MRETQKKGDIAKTQAIYTFTKLGYDVATLITESARYDLIIDVEGKLYRVQVKYCDAPDVDLRNIHSNAKGYVIKKIKTNDFDWLYIYSPKKGEFLIKESLVGRSAIRPQEKYRIKEV